MQWTITPYWERVNCFCLINLFYGSPSTSAARSWRKEKEWDYGKEERWNRKGLWTDHRWYLSLSGGWLPSITGPLTPVLQSLARNECRTMKWQEVLHKCYFVFCLGKLHQQRLRYSPSCLRFSARTSGNGAEVSNQGPGCDTCCSRTPGTSAHDTGFEHRSPTLAWAEPPLLTRSACRSTPNQSKATNQNHLTTQEKTRGIGNNVAATENMHCATREGSEILQASHGTGRQIQYIVSAFCQRA